jgi:hypothetical protein
MSTVFRPLGPTTFISANTSGVQANIVSTGAVTATYLKIDNINNASVDAFVNFGTANTTAATIANATSTGNSIVVQHNDTVYVATASGFNQEPATTLYVAAITASGIANVYITPVAIISTGN